MIFEFLSLSGYGQFVWPAFVFTFLGCFFLYLSVEKKYRKYEKKFLKQFNSRQFIRIKNVKEKKATSTSPIF
tara:strand:+ start:8021 stop:8236 length:216 start_codon:yes stop_codon:yes gene_type:complete